MSIAWALFRRWLYLLCIGMWKGECAVTSWERPPFKPAPTWRVLFQRARITFIGAQRGRVITHVWYRARPPSDGA